MKGKELAPIVLFTYNRPWHTEQVLTALKNNELSIASKLFVFSDGGKDFEDEQLVDETRKILDNITGFEEVVVVKRPVNFGLAANVINGVSTIVEEYGKVIVLEDDLITAPTFLKFMNNALDMYEDVEEVAHIHAFSYAGLNLPDTFFIRWVGSTGWATWRNAWRLFEPNGDKLLAELKKRKLTRTFDFNGTYPYTRMLKKQTLGKVNSWAIRWNASLFLNNKLSLNTGKSLIHNIGFDGSGAHSGSQDFYNMGLYGGELELAKPERIQQSVEARSQFEEFYRKTNSFWAKAKRRLQRMVKGDFS